MVQTKSVKKSGKIVNSKHVDSLLSNYKKERWVQNSKSIGKEDSLSVWYSIDELQAFVEMAKQNGADGIKMYFGVYKADTAAEARFEDRQTIVLVASKTKELDNGLTIDKNIYVNRDNKPEVLAFNAGRICPPACSGGGGGTDTSTGFDWDNPGILIDRQNEGMIVI
ncbi:MAG TPA: hypothetical protein VL307_07765 [Chitinophagaceae bacterium]|nr:hypothetical protein [Chitinophagaceae bacterium]